MSACPRCQTRLAPPDPVSQRHACATCGGGFFAVAETLTLLERHAGVARDVVLALANEAPPSGLSCPGCGAGMLALTLKGVRADWCRGCGGLWLDANEAAALSRGAVDDGAPAYAHAPAGGAAAYPGAGEVHDALLPGRSASQSEALLDAFLGRARGYQIHGHFRWLEALFGLEMANRYHVTTDSSGVGFALETTRGVLGVLARLFLGSHRPLEVEVYDPRETLVLTLLRPFFLFFSSMRVEDATGRKRGEVHRRFAFFGKHYDLIDATGRMFARVRSPFWRLWTFPIVDERGDQVAVVKKRWRGFGMEMFTDADRYTVEIADRPLTLSQRAVLFAACLSIDLDFFENNYQR